MIRLHIHLHHDNRHLAHHENLSTIEFFLLSLLKTMFAIPPYLMHKLASMPSSH